MGYWQVEVDTTVNDVRESLERAFEEYASHNVVPERSVVEEQIRVMTDAVYESLLPGVGDPQRIRIRMVGTTPSDPRLLSVAVTNLEELDEQRERLGERRRTRPSA